MLWYRQTGREYILDFDSEPFTPPGWGIRREDQSPYQITGEMAFDAGKIQLCAPDREMDATTFFGTLLLRSARIVPVQMLDFLLARQEFVPDAFKGLRPIFFTLYHISTGGPTPLISSLRFARILAERVNKTWLSAFVPLNQTIGPKNPTFLYRE